MIMVRLLPCLALAACASAPSNPEALGKEVVAAARAGDLAAFERLYWSPIASGEVCEPEVGESIAKERIRARQPFVWCRRQIAWDDVGDVHVTGGVVSRPLKKCGGRAIELEDIVVTFEMPGPQGKAYGRFELDDAIAYDDHVYLGGDFECRDVPKGYAACRDIVRRVTQRSVKEIGSRALELEGALMQGCETLDAPKQAKLAACVDGARDVTALDACYLHAHDLPSDPAGAADAGGALHPTCERFLSAYERCLETMPEAAREPARDGLRQMRQAWSAAPRDGMGVACQAAWDAGREGMSSICPDVWSDAPLDP